MASILSKKELDGYQIYGDSFDVGTSFFCREIVRSTVSARVREVMSVQGLQLRTVLVGLDILHLGHCKPIKFATGKRRALLGRCYALSTGRFFRKNLQCDLGSV